MAGVLTSSQTLRSRFRNKLKASSSGTTRKGDLITTVNDIKNILAKVVMVTVSTAFTKIEICGNTTAAADGTEYIIKSVGSLTGDAVNDAYTIEASAEEIMEVMYRDPGVGDRATKVEFLSVYAKVTCATGDVVVIETLVEDLHPKADLTVANEIA